MYKASFTDLAHLLGPQRLHELRPMLEQVLKGKRLHHLTGPQPHKGTEELITRLMALGEQIGFEVTWDRLWADAGFEQACDVLSQESLNEQFMWSQRLKQAYEEGLDYAKKQLRRHLWNADAVFVHDIPALPVVAERGAGCWAYFSYDYIGWTPRVFYESHIALLKKFDAVILPNAAFTAPELPPQHLWLPAVDVLAPRNRELEDDEAQRLWQGLALPKDLTYILYADRYDRLDHAEELLGHYLGHKAHERVALVIAGEAAETNPAARRHFAALRDRAKADPSVHVLALPANEALLNVLRRRSVAQLYWPRPGRTDPSLTEALWAGSPVIAMDTLGVRDIVRSGVTAWLATDALHMLDLAQQLVQEKKRALGLSERARMYAWDYLLLDNELMNLACFFVFKQNPQTWVDWTAQYR